MPTESPDLIALVGSRICHDLISPLGAIGNGLELLMMAGIVPGPELSLISESVTNANARIRFFRISFGAAAPGQVVSLAEVRSVLDDMTRGGRLKIDWEVAGEAARAEVKLAFLALQCLESALPYGGRVRVSAEAGVWHIAAEAAKLKLDPLLWAGLDGAATVQVNAAQVQFALLPAELARQGRNLTLQLRDTSILMRY